jgi:hypothetical protein
MKRFWNTADKYQRTKNKRKAILVTGLGGPCSCETSRLPHFIDNRLWDYGQISYKNCMKRFWNTVDKYQRIKNKGKAILVKGLGGPCSCETSRPPHFLGNSLSDDGQIVSLTRRPPFKPQERFLVLISVRMWVNPTAMMRLEWLRKLKNFLWPRRESSTRPAVY